MRSICAQPHERLRDRRAADAPPPGVGVARPRRLHPREADEALEELLPVERRLRLCSSCSLTPTARSWDEEPVDVARRPVGGGVDDVAVVDEREEGLGGSRRCAPIDVVVERRPAPARGTSGRAGGRWRRGHWRWRRLPAQGASFRPRGLTARRVLRSTACTASISAVSVGPSVSRITLSSRCAGAQGQSWRRSGTAACRKRLGRRLRGAQIDVQPPLLRFSPGRRVGRARPCSDSAVKRLNRISSTASAAPGPCEARRVALRAANHRRTAEAQRAVALVQALGRALVVASGVAQSGAAAVVGRALWALDAASRPRTLHTERRPQLLLAARSRGSG